MRAEKIAEPCSLVYNEKRMSAQNAGRFQIKERQEYKTE